MTFWIRRPRIDTLFVLMHRMFLVDGGWWIFRFGPCTRHHYPDKKRRVWWKPWTWRATWLVWRVQGRFERTDGPYVVVFDGPDKSKIKVYETTTLSEIVAAFREAGER